MVTKGQRQAAQQLEEEKRYNYKRWPWGSFFIAASISGIIFVLASSPAEIHLMTGGLLVLSSVMGILGILLLIPAAFGFFFLLGQFICRKAGRPCPCQGLEDTFANRKLARSVASPASGDQDTTILTSSDGLSVGDQSTASELQVKPPSYEDIVSTNNRVLHPNGDIASYYAPRQYYDHNMNKNLTSSPAQLRKEDDGREKGQTSRPSSTFSEESDHSGAYSDREIILKPTSGMGNPKHNLAYYDPPLVHQSKYGREVEYERKRFYRGTSDDHPNKGNKGGRQDSGTGVHRPGRIEDDGFVVGSYGHRRPERGSREYKGGEYDRSSRQSLEYDDETDTFQSDSGTDDVGHINIDMDGGHSTSRDSNRHSNEERQHERYHYGRHGYDEPVDRDSERNQVGETYRHVSVSSEDQDYERPRYESVSAEANNSEDYTGKYYVVRHFEPQRSDSRHDRTQSDSTDSQIAGRVVREMADIHMITRHDSNSPALYKTESGQSWDSSDRSTGKNTDSSEVTLKTRVVKHSGRQVQDPYDTASHEYNRTGSELRHGERRQLPVLPTDIEFNHTNQYNERAQLGNPRRLPIDKPGHMGTSYKSNDAHQELSSLQRKKYRENRGSSGPELKPSTSSSDYRNSSSTESHATLIREKGTYRGPRGDIQKDRIVDGHEHGRNNGSSNYSRNKSEEVRRSRSGDTRHNSDIESSDVQTTRSKQTSRSRPATASDVNYIHGDMPKEEKETHVSNRNSTAQDMGGRNGARQKRMDSTTRTLSSDAVERSSHIYGKTQYNERNDNKIADQYSEGNVSNKQSAGRSSSKSTKMGKIKYDENHSNRTNYGRNNSNNHIDKQQRTALHQYSQKAPRLNKEQKYSEKRSHESEPPGRESRKALNYGHVNHAYDSGEDGVFVEDDVTGGLTQGRRDNTKEKVGQSLREASGRENARRDGREVEERKHRRRQTDKRQPRSRQQPTRESDVSVV